MSMRGRSRRATTVSQRQFAWDRALVATLRHSTLPWDESLAVTPLAELRNLGARDRLSLLAQFAAHEALLQFAGVADGELDPAEWAAMVKRGSDVRLVRVSARAADASSAPPVLTLAQQFAELVDTELDVLRQPWARADAVYAEAYARLASDVSADLRWMRAAGCGEIAAPGPEALHALVSECGRFRYDEDALASIIRFAERVVILRGASPLERYSAVRPLIDDPSLDPPAAAERVIAATTDGAYVFVVANAEAFDEPSRQVVEILSGARHGTWLFPAGAEPLPPTRWFVVSPRLASRHELQDGPQLRDFVQSPAFGAYLADGRVPPRAAMLPGLSEPVRSYIGALALLGTRIPRALAGAFLAEFLFRGPLEDLVVEGVTRLDGDDFVILSPDAASLIPAASRPAICRVAAARASGVRAALLWIDAGDSARAAEVLEAVQWSSAEEIVEVLRQVPNRTPALASLYAHALVDCGRYRDAREVANGDEWVLARVERRTGDYATALRHVERIEPRTIEAELLRIEVLWLLDRDEDALRALDASDQEDVRVLYERGVHGADVVLPPEHYLAKRLETYRALERQDYDGAARLAAEAHARARCMTERIDASLDRLYATFSSGDWDAARAVAVEALQEVEETQGDRAAGVILFTLAYLAADAGQWAHAAQRIARLRQFYAATRDELRLRDLNLLTAHLDFCRGRFAEAKRSAAAVFDARGIPAQIREAAALILDQVDPQPAKRSTGKSGNAELTRRHHGHWPLAKTAREIARQFETTGPGPAEAELRVLRAAAMCDFPFAPSDLDAPWCFATRNRLGHWNAIGSHAPNGALDEIAAAGAPDWIACSERELLFIEGCSGWSADGREAVAAVFRTRAENHRLRRILEQEEQSRSAVVPVEGIVGESPVMREVFVLVTKVARRDVPVCILGESGTGKELVARAIHRHSSRRQKIFTAVNCAALPENLIESELFGHVRGAFTGADRDRPGLIETTDGGTLFLDEIGELPPGAQAKLLRFLQEGEFRRVGDTANRSADVRVVSATNRKLESAVEEGRFRDDLYYRIRGVEVALPPLRERGADIRVLAAHFLAAEREKHRSGPASFTPDVEAIFAAYSWPGNVRELQNTIRAAHAVAGEAKEVDVEHLPERLRNISPAKAAAGSYQDAVARFKRDLIERSLTEARGNQNRAASLLNMSRQALAYQIRELGILVKSQSRTESVTGR